VGKAALVVEVEVLAAHQEAELVVDFDLDLVDRDMVSPALAEARVVLEKAGRTHGVCRAHVVDDYRTHCTMLVAVGGIDIGLGEVTWPSWVEDWD
jgi:hypothetical protein